MMIPDSKNRMQDALQDLRSFLVSCRAHLLVLWSSLLLSRLLTSIDRLPRFDDCISEIVQDENGEDAVLVGSEFLKEAKEFFATIDVTEQPNDQVAA